MRNTKENETRGFSDRKSAPGSEKKRFTPKGPQGPSSDFKYSKKSETDSSRKTYGNTERKDFSDFRKKDSGPDKKFGSKFTDTKSSFGGSDNKRPRKDRFDGNSGPDKKFERPERASFSKFGDNRGSQPKRFDDKPSYSKYPERKTEQSRDRSFGDKPAFKSFDKDRDYRKTDKPGTSQGGFRRNDNTTESRYGKSSEKRDFKPRSDSFEKSRDFVKNDRPFSSQRETRNTESRGEGNSSEKREFKPRYNDSDRNRESENSGRSYSKPGGFGNAERQGSGNTYEKREFKPRFNEGDRRKDFENNERPTTPQRSPRSEGYTSEKREFKPRFADSDNKKSFDKTDRPTYPQKSTERNQNDRFPSEKREFKSRFSDSKSEKSDSTDRKYSEKRQFKSRDNQDNNSSGWILDKTADHERSRQVGLKQKPDYDRIKDSLPAKLKTKVDLEIKKDNGLFRLNRYLANAGLCSRREADDMIASGQITVNGTTITEMGYQVKPTDVVKYGRKILNREKIVYLLLNKPKDFVTTTEDPEGRKTVMDLVKNACSERIYPVGRLDRNTTGLLLLTNDGELADKLTHPSNNMRKVYQVELDKPIVQADFDKILEGIELEDGFVKADDLSVITPDNHVVGIEIHSGRNRIVRRMFESLGYEVTKLDRTTFAGLTKKDLPRGNWRFLTEKEVIRLKYLI